MNFLSTEWFRGSLMASLCIVPFLVFMPFFTAHLKMRPEAVLLGWFAGAIIGILAFSYHGSSAFAAKDLYTPFLPLLLVVAFGIIFGAPANILMFRAMSDPAMPSAAIPFTIVSSGNLLAYFGAIVVGRYLPQYFQPMQFNCKSVLAITFIIMGLALLNDQAG